MTRTTLSRVKSYTDFSISKKAILVASSDTKKNAILRQIYK